MYLIDVHPPTTSVPPQEAGGFRRSWGEGDAHLNAEHARIAQELKSTSTGRELLSDEIEKLYEIGFQSGAVILDIGLGGGGAQPLAVVRGALAGLAMSPNGRLPQYYGITTQADAVAESRRALHEAGLSAHGIVLQADLGKFLRLVPVVPTAVLVDARSGNHFAETYGMLTVLRETLATGTPVAIWGSRDEGVVRAVSRFVDAQSFVSMGRFGNLILLKAGDQSGADRRASGLPVDVFEGIRQSLQEVSSSGDSQFDQVARATRPARVAALAVKAVGGSWGKRGWPYDRPENTWFPATLPDGKPWPKISIVTPSYNYGQFIEETILSVLNQNYPNVEHIVMDGGSTDGTRDVIERYRHQLAFAVSEPDKGQSNAINKGFAKATGEIFTWINADDMLAPGALHGMAMAFWHSGADVVAGICEQYRDGRLIEKHMTCCSNGIMPLDEMLDIEGSWMMGQFFMQPEVMFTRAIWDKTGGMVREDLFYSMDYEMWLRFALAGARLHVIGRSICLFRHHGEQKTALAEKFIPELMRVRDTFAAEHHIVPADRRLSGSPRHQLRIASLSDVGFKLGAGIGQKRLIASLAAAGHDVYSFAAADDGASRDVASIDEIVTAIGAVSPDVVLIGNIHGARLSPEIISACSSRWATGVVMHDLWAVTGRCAYNGPCEKYLTGCDETCPTADEYPALPPPEIFPQWKKKYDIYRGERAPLLLANSEWTAAFARRALASQGIDETKRQVHPVRYGVELNEFRPLPKAFCRRELGLPEDRFLLLASASSLEDPRKGVRILADAVRQLSLPDVVVVCLGRPDDELQALIPGLKSLGYVRDVRRLAMVYSAVDLFVGASSEEAFGQVFTEAAACGTPSIGFPVGGIPESIADGVTGYLTQTPTADDLASAIYELYSDRERRRGMGVWGRIFAENEWSTERAYHQLHVALRTSGVSARLNFPPKIRFVPHPPSLPAPINLALHRGEWQPISGFEPWEGPYPDDGLPRCRWLTGPVSRFRVTVARPGPHRLRISCTTFHQQAVLRVAYKGQCVNDVAVPQFVRGAPFCEFECMLDLDDAAGPVELIHWPWAIEDSARGMSVLLLNLTITDPANDDLPLADGITVDTQPSDRT